MTPCRKLTFYQIRPLSQINTWWPFLELFFNNKHTIFIRTPSNNVQDLREVLSQVLPSLTKTSTKIQIKTNTNITKTTNILTH